MKKLFLISLFLVFLFPCVKAAFSCPIPKMNLTSDSKEIILRGTYKNDRGRSIPSVSRIEALLSYQREVTIVSLDRIDEVRIIISKDNDWVFNETISIQFGQSVKYKLPNSGEGYYTLRIITPQGTDLYGDFYITNNN